MLLRALQRARDKLLDALKSTSELEPAVRMGHKHAIDALVQAIVRIELHRRSMHDMKVKHLLIRCGRDRVAEVSAALETILSKEPQLADFGRVPWSDVDAAFTAAHTDCPPVLRKFHDEFQEELQKQ